jgi:two-component sensor histidine kinase
MKREFVSNVSHDLKTPLTSMQEAAQAVLDQLPGPLNDQQRRLLQLSLDSGQRLSSMIGKLLELSRLESGVGPEPRLELVDLARVARGAVQRAGVSSRSVLVVLDEPAESLHVRADADGIARVLDNLLENAIRFSPDGGAVRIHIGARGGAAVLTVADEGPGIPEPERERVFERFYQTADGRAARSHGVGLGLAICRHIVTSHHGSISIEGNTPGGTIVKVQLPLPTESRTSPPDDATRGKGFHDTRRGRRPLSAAAVALLLAITACATTRVPQHVAERDQMVRDIAALRARLDSARVDNDSLRLQAARLQFDLSDRDAELRALRLELERLKAIDLKPRPRLP